MHKLGSLNADYGLINYFFNAGEEEDGISIFAIYFYFICVRNGNILRSRILDKVKASIFVYYYLSITFNKKEEEEEG